MDPAQLKVKILLCYGIFYFQQKYGGILLHIHCPLHQKPGIKQMSIPVFGAIQHIIGNIVILRLHQDRVAARAKEGLQGITPGLILKSDHILTGKLGLGSNLSFFEFTVDLIPQAYIIGDLGVSIPMLFALLDDLVLLFQAAVSFLKKALNSRDLFHQLFVKLLCFLPEAFHRRYFFCSGIFLLTEGGQDAFVFA